MTGHRPSGSEAAARAWHLMSLLVLDEDRRATVAAALGMSFARTRALRRLAEGPLTLRDLAAHLTTDAPYATLMVDDLEDRGLAERTVHPQDRRAKLVQLTPAGHAAAARAQQILDEPPAALSALDPTDLQALLAILERVAGSEGRRSPDED